MLSETLAHGRELPNSSRTMLILLLFAVILILPALIGASLGLWKR
jgi:hypothetical protein